MAQTKTALDIRGRDFYINGKKTYTELPGSNATSHGLLMNARFIQGVFDDKAASARFARFGFKEWNPEDHTDRLIAVLPEWYSYGLRAFTVGFQGGGPASRSTTGLLKTIPLEKTARSWIPHMLPAWIA